MARRKAGESDAAFAARAHEISVRGWQTRRENWVASGHTPESIGNTTMAKVGKHPGGRTPKTPKAPPKNQHTANHQAKDARDKKFWHLVVVEHMYAPDAKKHLGGEIAVKLMREAKAAARWYHDVEYTPAVAGTPGWTQTVNGRAVHHPGKPGKAARRVEVRRDY